MTRDDTMSIAAEVGSKCLALKCADKRLITARMSEKLIGELSMRATRSGHFKHHITCSKEMDVYDIYYSQDLTCY
jgi:hypothetical protein